MAKTIAVCKGRDKTREKESHKLGSTEAEGQANTYRTFTTCIIRADGSGFVQVRRDDKTVHYFEFAAEENE